MFAVTISIAASFILTILLADFIAGVVHWREDAYADPDFPVIGKLIAEPNLLHHRKPRHFVHHSWWQSSWDLLLINAAIVLIAWRSGHLSWEVWLFAVVGTNANQIHKWAHRTPRENGPVVTALQRLRLIQTVRRHARHHTDPKNSHYCTITNVLNPLLDGIGFWEKMEWIIGLLFGIRRRVDPTVRTPQVAAQ